MKKLPTNKGSVNAFLEAAKKHPLGEHRAASKRLIFAMDATGSREHSWDLATSLHGQLFQTAHSKQLQVQLVYYRGINQFFASSWNSSAEQLLNEMQRVRCLGGATQIVRLLKHIYNESTAAELRAAVFIGDCVEESPDELFSMAGQLGLRNVPMFMFQEGHDPITPQVFAGIARRTNGAHIPFNAGSAKELGELLGAVAAYATEGMDAFKKIKGRAATLMLTQMRR